MNHVFILMNKEVWMNILSGVVWDRKKNCKNSYLIWWFQRLCFMFYMKKYLTLDKLDATLLLSEPIYKNHCVIFAPLSCSSFNL